MFPLDIEKVLCKRCNGHGYYLIGGDKIACPECHSYNPKRTKNIYNGTIKLDDIQFFVNARETETRELGGEVKRVVFTNKNRYLLQRAGTQIFVLWSRCESCDSDAVPDWDSRTDVFSCSICHAPV